MNNLRIIGIGGEPATGKTKLMRTLLATLSNAEEFSNGLCKGTMHPASGVIVLGTYDETTFGGTDKLSMAAQPDTIDYLTHLRGSLESQDVTIWFEGDRFFNAKFIEAMKRISQLTMILLTANKQLLDERHFQRNDTQNETWLKGRRTKYKKLQLMYSLPIYIHETPEQTEEIKSIILSNDKRLLPVIPDRITF